MQRCNRRCANEYWKWVVCCVFKDCGFYIINILNQRFYLATFAQLYLSSATFNTYIQYNMELRYIVTLYKNRPARRDCTNNYQCIEFPSITIKLFARVFVKGIQVLKERFYPESWCGFAAKRSILLSLIACPARRSIRSVWSRLRRNGHKRYLHFNHLLGGTF